MNTQVENFVVQEKHKAQESGVFFCLDYKEKVNYGDIVCNGFFESDYEHQGNIVPFLSVGIKKDIKKWLPIFVHETCHMDQWLEKSELWLNSKDYQVLNDWLQGNDTSQEQITSLVKKIISLEADCERRTIEKIKNNNLPIDIGYYAQRANAYLYFYQWMLKKRSWYKTAPYEINEILYYMPKEILATDNYLYPLSPTREKLFDKCLEEAPRPVNKAISNRSV